MEKNPPLGLEGGAFCVLAGKRDGLLLSGWADLAWAGLRDCLALGAREAYFTAGAGVMLCLRDSALAELGFSEALWDGFAETFTEACLEAVAELLVEGGFFTGVT